MPVFTLYTRKDCPLCAHMADRARQILREGGYPSTTLDEVDVDADPELKRVWGWEIPVLWADGREVCRHVLDVAALQACLEPV